MQCGAQNESEGVKGGVRTLLEQVCSNSGLGEVLEQSSTNLRMVLEQGVLTVFQGWNERAAA